MTDDEINKRFERMQAQYDARLKAMAEEIELLNARLPKPKPKIAFQVEFPPFSDITQIQAQRFDNSHKRGSGLSQRQLVKLEIWTCPETEIGKWPQGTIIPFFFPLDKNEAGDLAGCREIKGNRKGMPKGTKLIAHQAIGLMGDSCLLQINSDMEPIDLGTGTPTERTSPDSSIHVWKWSR